MPKLTKDGDVIDVTDPLVAALTAEGWKPYDTPTPAPNPAPVALPAPAPSTTDSKEK